MKTILIKILILVFIIPTLYIQNTLAADSEYRDNWGELIAVITTEKIPGTNCEKLNAAWEVDPDYEAKDGETQMYQCYAEKGFKTVMIMMWSIIKYFTYIAALWGVLFIIINGILYSMWWAEPSMKDDAKKRITWTIVWLVLLFLSWVILNLIAPWIYK